LTSNALQGGIKRNYRKESCGTYYRGMKGVGLVGGLEVLDNNGDVSVQ